VARMLKTAILAGFLAAGLSVAWRFLRARGASDVLAAYRDEPHAPDATPPAPEGTAGWGPLQTSPAANPPGAAPLSLAAPIVLPAAAPPTRTGPPSQDEIEATLQKRHLRLRGRHYGLKVVAVTLATILLVLVGTGFLAMKFLMGGGSESADSSFEEFAQFGQSGAASTTTSLAPGETAPIDTTATGAATGDTSTGDGTTGDSGSGDAAGGGAAAVNLRPPDGVYAYAGSGTMETKIFAFSSKTPIATSSSGTVAAAPNGCWSLLQVISGGSAGKTEQMLYCNPGAGALNSPGSQANQKQFGLTLTSNVTCSPAMVSASPGMQPGQTFPANCTVKNTGVLKSDLVLKGTSKYVGLETVDVGGTAVQAYHVYDQQDVSGDVTGVIKADNWIATSNGLRIKTIRHQEFGGFASQIEDSTFVLKSLTPS